LQQYQPGPFLIHFVY